MILDEGHQNLHLERRPQRWKGWEPLASLSWYNLLMIIFLFSTWWRAGSADSGGGDVIHSCFSRRAQGYVTTVGYIVSRRWIGMQDPPHFIRVINLPNILVSHTRSIHHFCFPVTSDDYVISPALGSLSRSYQGADESQSACQASGE